ncbi:sensor histidine kinase, partial [Enterobacter sp. CM29]
DAVELSVEDSGPGIAEDQISQAMLPFHRLDNVGDAAGSGIGLALANDIARLHRSHLQLMPSENLGGLCVKMRFLLMI